MTTVASTTRLPMLDTPNPQPLPGHGDDAGTTAPATPGRTVDWHAVTGGLAVAGVAAAVGATTLAATTKTHGRAFGIAAGIGLATALTAGISTAIGPKPAASPGKATAIEVLRPLAVPVAVLGGIGAGVVSLNGALEMSDAAFTPLWHSFAVDGARASWATIAVAGGALGAAALVANAKEQ